jgi:hypothetical protein
MMVASTISMTTVGSLASLVIWIYALAKLAARIAV